MIHWLKEANAYFQNVHKEALSELFSFAMLDSGRALEEYQTMSADTSHEPSPRDSLFNVPQITLTTSQTEDLIEPVQPLSTPHVSTPHVSTPHVSTPLPLTRETLNRKNKIDTLLHAKSTQRRYAVDERVTAGLGIATPQDNLPLSSTDFYSRRGSTRAGFSDDERPWYRSQPSSPKAGDSPYYHWRTPTGALNDSLDTSFKDRKLSATSSFTSQSENASTKMVNTDTHAYRHTKASPSAPPPPPLYYYTHFPSRKRHGLVNYTIDYVYKAAARVIHTRAPEADTPPSHPTHYATPQRDGIHPTANPSLPTVPHDWVEHTLQGYSLYLFSPTHPIRRRLWKVVRSR
ncbi:hypothetical protein BDF14DRAFT_898152 [Spinellus fusiger]|nr:hypothetical protein BDF14DRAFT_898152 [Spinellus fusiger]